MLFGGAWGRFIRPTRALRSHPYVSFAAGFMKNKYMTVLFLTKKVRSRTVLYKAKNYHSNHDEKRGTDVALLAGIMRVSLYLL